MLRQFLARLIPKRRPGRRGAIQAIEASTHEPLCDTILSEVYYAHAAIHGANKLLPGEAFPDPSEQPRAGNTGGNATLV